MNLMEILREYNSIDKKIEVEKLSIQMGNDYVTELCKAFESRWMGDRQGDAGSDDRLALRAEQVRAEIHEDEWRHLMEYRRLMQIKITCMKAIHTLGDDGARLLRERAVEGKSWRQLQPSYAYSESQLRRRFVRAFARFSSVFNALMAENERKSL